MKTKTSKKVLSAILAFVMIMCTGVVSFSSFAANTETETVGDVTYEISENCITKVTVKDGVSLGNYTVPDKVGGIPVSSIGAGAYMGLNITTLTIPKSVEEIGSNAFSNCKLTCVNFNSNNCTVSRAGYTSPLDKCSIGSEAFSGNSALTKFVFGDNVTSIPANVCTNIASLSEVEFKATVSKIGNGSFALCTGLKKIDMSNITVIDVYGFAKCTSLETIKLPKAVTIGGEAFRDCSNIKSVEFPKATSISDCAFMGSGITEITIPKSVEGIGGGAFRACTALETVYYNSSSCAMPYYVKGEVAPFDNQSPAFYGCSSLTTIVFGDNVTSIPANAFTGVISLETVEFKAAAEAMGKNAFYGISTPDTIKYAGTEAQWNALEDAAESGNEKLFACTNYKFNSKPDTDEPITIENNDAGVQVECPNNSFDNNVDVNKIKLNVEKTSADAEVDRIVNEYSLTRIPDIDVYNISLTYNGEEIQPNGKVTVRIPYSGTINDISKVKIFHYYNDKNNKLVVERSIDVKLINGYLEFETNHFSKFIAIKEDKQPQPSTISIAGTSLNYKSGTTLTTDVNYNGEGNYTVKYTSSNPNVVSVDDNGYVYGANKGTATITAELQDARGNTVASDSTTVSVSYTWWQWLIKIVLFGWLWY